MRARWGVGKNCKAGIVRIQCTTRLQAGSLIQLVSPQNLHHQSSRVVPVCQIDVGVVMRCVWQLGRAQAAFTAPPPGIMLIICTAPAAPRWLAPTHDQPRWGGPATQHLHVEIRAGTRWLGAGGSGLFVGRGSAPAPCRCARHQDPPRAWWRVRPQLVVVAGASSWRRGRAARQTGKRVAGVGAGVG